MSRLSAELLLAPQPTRENQTTACAWLDGYGLGGFGVGVFLQKGVGAEGQNLGIHESSHQGEAGCILTALTTGKTGVGEQCCFVHQPMRIVLYTIDAAYWNCIPRNKLHENPATLGRIWAPPIRINPQL